MSLLQLEDVKLKINGKEILKGITANLDKGKVYAFVGPNGAGKSTLAYTIMGLEGYRNIEGDIIFEGESIKKTYHRRESEAWNNACVAGASPL